MPVINGFSFLVNLLLHVGMELRFSLLRSSYKNPLLGRVQRFFEPILKNTDLDD